MLLFHSVTFVGLITIATGVSLELYLAVKGSEEQTLCRKYELSPLHVHSQLWQPCNLTEWFWYSVQNNSAFNEYNDDSLCR